MIARKLDKPCELCMECMNTDSEYEVILNDGTRLGLCHNCLIDLETRILQAIRSQL